MKPTIDEMRMAKEYIDKEETIQRYQNEQYCPNREDIDTECQKESCEMCWLDWLKRGAEDG